MTDTPPTVALLFDDTELGGQLRDALRERGARIVHEGGVSGFGRKLLQQVSADVLVVNLDDGADDALDQLYDLLDGDQPRVVFNDAQASRKLVGWDRARWARHLAAKVLAMGDVDPPRPEAAQQIQVPPAANVTPTAALENRQVSSQGPVETPPGLTVEPLNADEMLMIGPDADLPDDQSFVLDAPAESGPEATIDTDLDIDLDFSAFDDVDAPADESLIAESEDLAAELEALLASGDPPDEQKEGVTGPGLRFAGDEQPPPLHDGKFGVPESRDPDQVEAAAGPVGTMTPDAALPPFDADHLQLSDPMPPAVASKSADAAQPMPSPAPVAVSAPDSWALLEDAAPEKPDDKPHPSEFGIEKLSAAEFLAPDVEAVSPDVHPTMSLELVSMEEAIAPQAYVHDHEMVLDELGSALSRIVLLGASIDGVDSMCQFLQALPPTTRLTFLLTQHLGGRSDAQLLGRIAAQSPLPVRLADAGRRAGLGEVLMVPAGQQVRLRRDGSVELLTTESAEPSIDASLSMAANVFGRDAVAIVFAGRGNDAVAGAQAIHDRGGQVWVESSPGDHFTDMVSGIFAERLVSFSGTPPELAARLVEVSP